MFAQANPVAVLTQEQATVGAMLPESVIPAEILSAGGGWFSVDLGGWRKAQIYTCRGCHKDGQYGFQVKEIRR